MTDTQREEATDRIRTAFPDVQVIYVFGSVAPHEGTAPSDVDIGMLLPHAAAVRADGARVRGMNNTNDIVINKIESIQRCVKRAREELAAADDLKHDYTHQAAAILNVTRSCEQTIDVIRREKPGIPKDRGDSFDLLAFTDRVLARERQSE